MEHFFTSLFSALATFVVCDPMLYILGIFVLAFVILIFKAIINNH